MIANIDYYKEQGFQEGEQLEKALMRAEKLIELVTMGRSRDYKNMRGEVLEQLKYAICAQAERFITTGFHEGDDVIDCKVKIGDFSYESKNNGVAKSLSPLAQSALKLAGLLYMGTEAR